MSTYPVCFWVGVTIRNSHSAAPAKDSRPVQDTGRRAPRIYTANRARCTVARPQRSARATALTLSPAARRGVGALIQRGGRAVAGMLTIATAGGS